jgi:hypothetical protein
MTSIAPGLSPAKVKRLEEQVAKRMKRFADNPRGKPMIAQPMPRPQIDEGFGNGPGRPNMPLVKPIANGGTQAGALSPRGAVTGGGRPAPDTGFGNGAGLPMPTGGMPVGGGMDGGFGGGMDGVGGMRRGGKVQKMASGGSASKRADGIATKGKTKGRMC